MTAGVGLLEVRDIQPRVAVEGLEALVAEELLDVVEVGVALHQLAGVASPQRVRRDGDIQVHGAADLADGGPEHVRQEIEDPATGGTISRGWRGGCGSCRRDTGVYAIFFIGIDQTTQDKTL